MTKLIVHSLDDAAERFAVLDLLPDTHAWLKNARGHFVYGNRLFYERFGITSLEGLLGKCDYDIAPGHLAQNYVGDDARVLQGAVVIDRLELILGPPRGGDWFLTSKWPVYDHQERIIASFGISRHLQRSEGTARPVRELRAPVDYICQNFARSISVASLASACNLSVSALERRFRKHLDKTPHQYLNEVRLTHARQMLLETDKPVGTIAVETGFADHSHFSRAYARHFGEPPRATRTAAQRP